MAISFVEFDVAQFRAKIADLPDDELVRLGRSLRKLCYPRRISPIKSAFDIQLEECRAEWRRRHPANRSGMAAGL